MSVLMDEKVNILVVDDLPEKLLVLQSILEELQQNLVLVRSGREALQQLLDRDFAVILLDVNMPDIDGFETAKLIRQYRRTKQTPIVFITAYVDDIQAVQGYALGAVDYISTPVVPEILRSKIKVFIDLYRMHNQLRRQAEEREALARAEAARAAAETAMRRADLLSEVSHILARSLDIDTTVEGLLDFSVPKFSPIAIVALFDEQNAAMHTNVAWQENAKRRSGATALSPQVLTAITRVNIDDDILVLPAIEWQIEIVDEVAEKRTSVVIEYAKVLPLFTRGRAIGAIILGGANNIFAPSDFNNDDTLLKEIASRAAIALENSLLYQAIHAADRGKNEFLAMLAHELRNPLAPIRNAVHILQFKDTSEDELKWATDVIGRQIDHMARMMDDLLDVSRIARGTVSIQHEKVLLGNVIERSVETSLPLIKAREHKLWVELPSHEVALHGDPVRLAQIFSNLLNNAVKYSPPCSDIWIKAVFENDFIEVSVRDNGDGISPEFLPHVFDLFAQGDKAIDRTQSGLGVGLTLVKHLIDLHHGTVEVESPGAGKGAEFTVRLPARRHERHIEAPVEKPQPVGGGRVLIVDDLQASAESMKLLLRMKGYEVEAVFDGPSALELTPQFHPDVILLDIGLPGMDGFEVARRLRADNSVQQPFLVALTGYGQESDRLATAAAGFDAHIIKPASIDSLLKLIGDYCARQTPQSSKAAIG
jgi:signal transduction histidine kinase/DNA-binding response OmpR family regulator